VIHTGVHPVPAATLEQRIMATRRRMFAGVVVLTISGAGLFLARPTYIKVSGIVHVPEDNASALSITVEDAACDTIWRRSSRNKRFSFRLEENDTYVARFEQPGCITKEVRLDTRHATKPWDTDPKSIKFEVVLAYVDSLSPFSYAGPVGRIAFNRKNRSMAITRNYDLQPVRVDSSALDAPEEMLLP
jgi:hypothetical protein